MDNGGIIYGTGVTAGNEAGYITGVRNCEWTPEDAPVYDRSHPMRIIVVYNATQYINGAMLFAVTYGHDLPEETQ